MSTAVGWKRFKFFEETRLQANLPDNVTCACADAYGRIWIGSTDGFIASLNSDLNLVTSFSAYQGSVRLLTTEQDKLIAIGQDGGDATKLLTLKAWELPSTAHSTMSPPSLTSSKLFPSGKHPEGDVTSLTISASSWPSVIIAAGFSTGAVQLIKGDACRGKLALAFPPQVLAGNKPITSLHFTSRGQQHIFATTATNIAAISAQTGQVMMSDDCGALPGCTALCHISPSSSSVNNNKSSNSTSTDLLPESSSASKSGGGIHRIAVNEEELAVAGPEAVCFYSVEAGRKSAFALRGEKHLLESYDRYLVTALPGDASSSEAVLQVVDPWNKIVAASVNVSGPVKWIVAVHQRDAHHSSSGGGGSNTTSSSTNITGRTNVVGGIIAADASGAAVRLTEKPLSEKLDMLYRSRAFHLALNVAEADRADARVLADVRRRFGDFLYGKRDYDGATEQYSATVGVLEPSYVIQRFLDAQRIHNLTTYLEALHATGKATADHTTLLLNCYTKQKDVAKLDAFVGMIPNAHLFEQQSASGLPSSAPTSGQHQKRKFDPETAVLVLRGAGYHNHALFLAKSSGQGALYLDILMEDCKNFVDALAYIKSLPRRAAADSLKRYGSALVNVLPIETTALLMELCLHQTDSSGDSKNVEEINFVANMADFTHIYADRPDDLRYACVTILEMNPDSPSRQVLYHTLLDLYLTEPQQEESTKQQQSGENNNNKNSNRRDALDLLRRGWLPGQDPAYDVDRALVVCRSRGFSEGLVFLYDRLRMPREALAVLADVGDWPGVLEAVECNGDASTGGDPLLWHYALERVSSLAAGPGAMESLKILLDKIEQRESIPPLVVLQILARNPQLKLELVKGFVTRQLQVINKAIRVDQEENERLKGDIEKTKDAVKKLQTEPVIFQSNRDSATSAPLEPPSVHFLCGHSFNLRTLGDGEEQQCPICAPEHQRTRELQKSHQASAADKDAFFRQLRTAPDGFGLISQYFSKGLLNHTTVSQGNGSTL